MRIIVISFALLACVKVWTQDRIYRTIMSEALLQAYSERAQQVCAREVAKSPKVQTVQWPLTSAEITIGRRTANVALWDYDNPLWDVRYRHPQLVLTNTATNKLQCNFDIVVGIASLSAL